MLIMALCLCLVACERNEEVVVCTVQIEGENVVAQYPMATVTCMLQSDATIEEVTLQLSQTQDFAQFTSHTMTLQEDGSYSAQLTSLTEDILYYIRYEVSNRYTSISVTQLTTLIVTAKPELITTEVENISMFSAMVGGNVLKDNGYDVTERALKKAAVRQIVLQFVECRDHRKRRRLAVGTVRTARETAFFERIKGTPAVVKALAGTVQRHQQHGIEGAVVAQAQAREKGIVLPHLLAQSAVDRTVRLPLAHQQLAFLNLQITEHRHPLF